MKVDDFAARGAGRVLPKIFTTTAGAISTVLVASLGPVAVLLLFFIVWGYCFHGRTVCEQIGGKRLQCGGRQAPNGRLRYRWRWR